MPSVRINCSAKMPSNQGIIPNLEKNNKPQLVYFVPKDFVFLLQSAIYPRV
jgi:hypothetical protein